MPLRRRYHRRRHRRRDNTIANLIFRNFARSMPLAARARCRMPMLVSFYWRRVGNYIASSEAIVSTSV